MRVYSRASGWSSSAAQWVRFTRLVLAATVLGTLGCASRTYTTASPKTEVIVEIDGKAGVMRWREPGKSGYVNVPLAVGTNRVEIGEITMRVHSNTLLSWGKLSNFEASKGVVKIGSSETGTEVEKLGPVLGAIFEAGFKAGKMATGVP